MKINIKIIAVIMEISIDSITDDIIRSIDQKNTINLNSYTRFGRLNEDEEVLNKLSLLRDQGPFPNSVDQYLSEMNHDELSFYRFFERNIPLTDSMNPHRKPYSLAEYFVSDIDGRRLNHLVKLYDLLDMNKSAKGENQLKLITYSREHGGIVVLGEKGSGKTFSQNIWLHENNSLLEENKIFWVRVDVSKIFDIWRSSYINNKNLVRIEDYFLGQLVYVFAKHYNENFPLFSPLFGEIANRLKNSDDNYLSKLIFENKSDVSLTVSEYERFSLIAKNNRWSTILDCIKTFEEQIAIYEGYNKGDGGRKSIEERSHQKKSFLVDRVLIESQKYDTDPFKGSKNSWLIIGSLLKNFILENGYNILLLIDGLDNLNIFDKETTAFSQKIQEQIFNGPLKNHTSHPNELLLISLRNDTYLALVKYLNTKLYNDRDTFKDIDAFYKINMDTVKIQNPIFEKRIQFVLKEYRGPDCFMRIVVEDIAKNHFIEDENRWNSNIRCFLNNHLSLSKLITFRYYFANKPLKFDIQDQISKFEDINYLLNGNLFLDDESRNPLTNKGYNFFNIFRYQPTNDPKPNYLIYVRIIQIILNNNRIDEKKLFEIASIFDLNPNDVDVCLNRMVKTGIISGELYGTNYQSVKYYLTTKGTFFYKKFFSSIHYLYHASIDTPLPYNILSKLNVHSNQIGTKTNYAPNCLISGIRFLEFIIQHNNHILMKVKRNNKVKIDVSNYEIPTLTNLLTAFRKSIFDMVQSAIRYDETRALLNLYFNLTTNEYDEN